ncbi:hypothetical protein [Streptomyces sp. NPDC101206]|uniref:hypothetical protein n=1 Tax=Streptomyces sp. NPDC101206 TaxID=3366128 RepID=UPI003824A611
MFEERLAEFSRERLGGRPIPDDLRTMLVAQWEDRADFRELLDITFLEAGRLQPLLDTGYLSEAELADPEMQAVNAALVVLAEYVKIVAERDEGWIGYWVHPDEPADRPPVVVGLDTEFTLSGMAGSSLAEACAADQVRYAGEPDARTAFASLAGRLAELGVPLRADDYDDLSEPGFTVDPEALTEELIDAERARRGLA